MHLRVKRIQFGIPSGDPQTFHWGSSLRTATLGKVKVVEINCILRYNNAIFVATVKLELCVAFSFNKPLKTLN